MDTLLKDKEREDLKRYYFKNLMFYVLFYAFVEGVSYLLFGFTNRFYTSTFIFSLALGFLTRNMNIKVFNALVTLIPYNHAGRDLMFDDTIKDYSKHFIVLTHIISYVTKFIGFFALSFIFKSNDTRLIVILIALLFLLMMKDSLYNDLHNFDNIYKDFINTIRKLKRHKK